MRLFVAVNFSENVRDSVAEAIESFPVYDPPWRWAHASTWHITLKFLGETPESGVEPIARCLESVCSRHRPFRLSLGPLGGFPNLSRPRVLFYAVESGKEHLTRLAAEVDAGLLEALGIPKEDKPFRAHATVARIKTKLPRAVADKLKLADPLSGVSQTVTSVELMSSELRREGAIYRCVKGFALPPAS